MLYAMDPVVNEAAKWSSMVGGQAGPAVTIRAIINRGGEQGAQHSQALHSWFAHVPGLRVVMPATVADARDLLIASALSPDPVIFIDDRWLYDQRAVLPPLTELDLEAQAPTVLSPGDDVTLVGCGWTTRLCLDARSDLADLGVSAEVVDLRVLNPYNPSVVVASVAKTGRLVAVDGGWSTAGMAAEILACVAEGVDTDKLRAKPRRVTLPPAPAPTSRVLESAYYPTVEDVVAAVLRGFDPPRTRP